MTVRQLIEELEFMNQDAEILKSVNENYKHKHKIGDFVKFDNDKARVEKVYIASNGTPMYTIGSSKHGNIDIEAEE